MVENEKVEPPLEVACEGPYFYLMTQEGDNTKIVSSPFKTIEEANTEKLKREKKPK